MLIKPIQYKLYDGNLEVRSGLKEEWNIIRPTNSIVLYSQMIGRGLRGPKMGGNKECLLIDISDNYEKFSDENRAFDYFTEYWGE